MGRRPGIFWDILTTFGLGHMRPASGTWGSMPPVALAGVMMLVGAGPAGLPWVYAGVLVVIVLVFGFTCALRGDEAEARWGVDPSEVVADETAGVCIPLLLIPAAAEQDAAAAVVLLLGAFFAFRFFDIVKLEPARSLQRLHGGWGILLDDLAAGIYAGVVVWVLGLIVT